MSEIKGKRMSTNAIDRMTESEAKSLLNDICSALQIGGQVRNQSVVMTNIKNAIRRSDCLSRIENLYTKTEVDESGEEAEVSLLRWGQNPAEYEANFREVAGFDS